jgi:Regulatory CLIP domain of proteinases
LLSIIPTGGTTSSVIEIPDKNVACNCMKLDTCTVLVEYFKTTPMTPTAVQKFQTNNCEYNKKKQIMVCCPNRILDELGHQEQSLPSRFLPDMTVEEAMEENKLSWIWELEDDLPYWDVNEDPIPVSTESPKVTTTSSAENLDVTLAPILESTVLTPTKKPGPTSVSIISRITPSANASISFEINPHDCGMPFADLTADRIMGGKDARLGQHPWMAMLGFLVNSKFFWNLRLGKLRF